MPGRQPRYLKLGPLYDDDPPTGDSKDPPAQKPKEGGAGSGRGEGPGICDCCCNVLGGIVALFKCC